VPAGKKAIVCVAGKFGERWRNIAKAYGIEAIQVTVPWGKAVTPEMVEAALKDHPDAVAVCTTLSETSTGIGTTSRRSARSSRRRRRFCWSMGSADSARWSAGRTLGTSTSAARVRRRR